MPGWAAQASGSDRRLAPQSLGVRGPLGGRHRSRSWSQLRGARLVLLGTDPRRSLQMLWVGLAAACPPVPGSLCRAGDGVALTHDLFCVCACVPPALPLAFPSEVTLGTAHVSLPHLLPLLKSLPPPTSPCVVRPSVTPHPHVPSSGSLSSMTVSDSGPAPCHCFPHAPGLCPPETGSPGPVSALHGLGPRHPLLSWAGPCGVCAAPCCRVDVLLSCVSLRMLGRRAGKAGGWRGCLGPPGQPQGAMRPVPH